MLPSLSLFLLGFAASTVRGAAEDAYNANLTFLPPRTLDVGPNLTVVTQTGTFIGQYNDSYPNVRQFLRVPFAQPPVGSLRWQSPQRLDINPTQIIDSTRFGPNCAQYVPGTETFVSAVGFPSASRLTSFAWNLYAPSNQVASLGQMFNSNQVSWGSAEDCLTLAVWTPAYANKTSNLPVALFVTGGGMITGGVDIPSQLPTDWVSRSQEHIAVTINYRLNIFGNPIAKALGNESFQLQDVRAAVEWVYENIAAFGGDPDNILLWGQSAGATLTHLYTLAYPDFPIAKQFAAISAAESETVTASVLAGGDVYDQFDVLSQALGCDYGTDYDAQLDCMRTVSWVQISEFINVFNFTPGVAYNFAYLPPDDIYVFANETARYASGAVAPGPMIRSDVLRESPSVNTTAVYDFELTALCYALEDAVLRAAAGLETYKYMYAGNFSNISPVPWLGAYHWTDLLMIFGSYATMAAPGSSVSALEVQTSEVMQDYMLAFLKDPDGLPGLGWALFDANATDGGVVLEFGNGTAVQNQTGDFFFGACFNSSIPLQLDG